MSYKQTLWLYYNTEMFWWTSQVVRASGRKLRVPVQLQVSSDIVGFEVASRRYQLLFRSPVVSDNCSYGIAAVPRSHTD